jgi:transglutaminase-like putative cysteine protease
VACWKTLLALAVAAAIALPSTACGWAGGADGTRSHEPVPSTSAPDFLAPLTDEQAARDLFEVEADHAEYWRMFTLDRYDGESWTSSNPDGSEGGVHLSAPASLPRSDVVPPAGGTTLNQTFRILGDLDIGHTLPMAQTAEEVAGPIGTITWDPARDQAFIDGRLEAGMTYTVRSRVVLPTPEELDRVDHLPTRTYGRWTELPADLDPRIGRIAERWTADATSDYRKVLTIQQRFHNGDFVYSTDVEPVDDADALLEFITQTKTGFCQQYSSAMAVMVRTLGLPARIGVGYRAGTRKEDGRYLVQSDDAHVWVEVLFPGYGWLQFEPEAGTAHPNAQAGTYLNPVTPTDAS